MSSWWLERIPVAGPAIDTTTYATNAAHFYTQAGGESRTTHHGFLNGDGTHFYRYDAWGRLTEVRAAASGAVIRTHVYDCEGRRVLETETNGGAPVTTRYVFWGAGLAASYTDAAGGNVQRTYGFVGGADGEAFVRVQQGSADNVFELARDFQGSILALIQRTNPASVSVVERYRYEPFGKVAIENASGQPLAQSGFGNDRFFLGRVWDAEVGLYDVRARWYEPDLGAFPAPDPLGAVDSWNFYQYGLAEPNSVLDPFGLQAVGTGASTSAADRIKEIDARIAELQKRAQEAELVEQLPYAHPECDLAGGIYQEMKELQEERDGLTQTVSVQPPGTTTGEAPSGVRGPSNHWALLVSGALAEPTPAGELLVILAMGVVGIWSLVNPTPSISVESTMSDGESRKSDKEKANDTPSWLNKEKPGPNESATEFAERKMKEKYGENWRETKGTGPGGEYNKIKKWGERSGSR